VNTSRLWILKNVFTSVEKKQFGATVRVREGGVGGYRRNPQAFNNDLIIL